MLFKALAFGSTNKKSPPFGKMGFFYCCLLLSLVLLFVVVLSFVVVLGQVSVLWLTTAQRRCLCVCLWTSGVIRHRAQEKAGDFLKFEKDTKEKIQKMGEKEKDERVISSTTRLHRCSMSGRQIKRTKHKTNIKRGEKVCSGFSSYMT